MEGKENTQVIVLAAGKGTRMNADVPKVLMPFGESTMVEHLIEHGIKPAGFKHKPVVVVGYAHEMVREALGDQVVYAHQEEQLGTGHAVQVGLEQVDPSVEQVVVLYGDMPLVTAETIQLLAKTQHQTASPVTMLTVSLPDYEDWRAGFYNWGRVLRNADNEIQQVVERKDATDEQKSVTEVTSAHFALDTVWLRKVLPRLSNNNASGEYYLTSLPEMATADGHKIQWVAGNPEEVVGANTVEEFQLMQRFVS